MIAIQSIQQGIARLLPVYETFSGEATECLGDTRLRALRRQPSDLSTCEWVGRRGQNRDDRTVERMREQAMRAAQIHLDNSSSRSTTRVIER